MVSQFDQRLKLVATQHANQLQRIHRGIEKEGLRTTTEGLLAQTPHPIGLGSALTHSSITTDYSEALLEFITPVFTTPAAALESLTDIHRYCYSQLDNEIVWAASMPCFIGGEDAIPIARYGSSNVGTLKHVYRVGLAHRYGKMMQTIAGIHYNFSLPEEFWPQYQQSLGEQGSLQDFRTAQYFALIRNFRRYSWLILYLFGASPAVCPSFVRGKKHRLELMDKHTAYAPHGTSLRMGDMGYQNNAQQHLNVCYNTLANYIRTLSAAIHTPHPEYESIGVKVDGQYRQLNSYVLQIENEYYSDIRPKRVSQSGLKPLQELDRNGVQYIEVRNVDINPYLPGGIDLEQIRFLDCFLLYCLLEESPFASEEECDALADNKSAVVNRGREPGLMLARCNQREQSLVDWGMELLAKMENIAALLDEVNSTKDYSTSIAAQREKLRDPSATPSAQILQDLAEQNLSFFEFALQQSLSQGEAFKNQPLAEPKNGDFKQMAQQSLADQANLEASDTLSFDDYLADYLAS